MDDGYGGMVMNSFQMLGRAQPISWSAYNIFRLFFQLLETSADKTIRYPTRCILAFRDTNWADDGVNGGVIHQNVKNLATKRSCCASKDLSLLA
jgi:hypothetical protein